MLVAAVVVGDKNLLGCCSLVAIFHDLSNNIEAVSSMVPRIGCSQMVDMKSVARC